MSNTGFKNVSRFSDPRLGEGFQVNVQWKGERLYKRFYGIDKGTLMEAVQQRDWMEEELHKPRSERRILPARGFHIDSLRGNAVSAWNPARGKQARRCFSIRKYGLSEALRLAERARTKGARAAYFGGQQRR